MKHNPVLFLKTQIAFFVNRVEDPCILKGIEKGTLPNISRKFGSPLLLFMSEVKIVPVPSLLEGTPCQSSVCFFPSTIPSNHSGFIDQARCFTLPIEGARGSVPTTLARGYGWWGVSISCHFRVMS